MEFRECEMVRERWRCGVNKNRRQLDLDCSNTSRSERYVHSQDNSELMRRMVEVFNTGDTSAVELVVSPNYVDHQGIGGAEVFGADGFANVVTLARQAHPQFRVEIQELNTEGDKVTVRLVRSQPGAEISPSPKRVQETQRQTIEVVRFANGLAVEHWGERLGFT